MSFCGAASSSECRGLLLREHQCDRCLPARLCSCRGHVLSIIHGVCMTVRHDLRSTPGNTELLLFRCLVHPAVVSSCSRISSSSRGKTSTSSSSSLLQQHYVPLLAARARRLLADLASVARPLTLQGPRSAAAAAAAETEDPVWVKSLAADQPRAWATATEAPADDANCAQFPGCAPGSCVSTDAGFKCTSCQGSLFVSKAEGTCGKHTGSSVCFCVS